MSIAGIRSNRGDAYQRAVALHYCVQMIVSEEIGSVQVDSVALPDQDYIIFGDDIVVLKTDGTKEFKQAKVNEKTHSSWTLTNNVLIKELSNAKSQLTVEPNSLFWLYSRTTFGGLQRLVEESNLYPHYKDIDRVATQNHKNTLIKLAEIWQLDERQSFDLVKRLRIGSHLSTEEWENLCLDKLQQYFSNPNLAITLIYQYVDKQHSKLGDPTYLITRETVLARLRSQGCYMCGDFSEQVTVDEIQRFSLTGRQWIRTVAGTKILRTEVDALKKCIDAGTKSILLSDDAGGGKTCILLDLMDYLDSREDITALYIRGDLYSGIESINELETHGLSPNLLVKIAHLAEKRQIVVIVDSLDVLAIGRSHKCLTCFLGFIANLSLINNVSVIAASRTFDAKYTPLLRHTEWSEELTVRQFSYENQISPVLVDLGIDPSKVDVNFRSLLCVPNNLKLFCVLVEKGIDVSEIEGHDLYEMYIDEHLINDTELGLDVVVELERIAVGLLESRSYEFAKSSLRISPLQLQRLLSQDVLTEISPHQIMFGHQSLADALRIRRARLQGDDLKAFVLSQPQLPFVRPALRAFVVSTRLSQPNLFTKQVRSLVTSEDVSMHLKRLVVQSLAGFPPRSTDLSIVMMLETDFPDLFKRFLDAASSSEWYCFLHKNWLPHISRTSSRESINSALQYFPRHIENNEADIIAIWTVALNEHWVPDEEISHYIGHKIQKISDWNVVGAKELLEKLCVVKDGYYDYLKTAIPMYIESTGGGDKLLWDYIISDTPAISDICRGREILLNARFSHTAGEKYLENRLKSSDEFFGYAMEFLLAIGGKFDDEDTAYGYMPLLLDCTSYRLRHSQSMYSAYDEIHEFLDGIEGALKHRARVNDDSWRAYEPRLRISRDLGLRYLVCEAYMENIGDNKEGISWQLNDPDILIGSLSDEMDRLASDAYPHIEQETQLRHQEIIADYYENHEQKTTWVSRKLFERLIWLPVTFRSDRSLKIVDAGKHLFENALPSYSINSQGGWISSPVPLDTLVTLSHKSLIEIFRHYNDYQENGFDEGLVGGKHSLESALATASSWMPLHFMPLIPLIVQSSLSIEYIYSIIEGISRHISSALGKVRSSDWKAVEPLPDLQALSQQLLDLVDRYLGQDVRGNVTCGAIRACSFVLKDEVSTEKIGYHLWKLGLSKSPSASEDDSDLTHTGINSVRGVAAEIAFDIGAKRLEAGMPIPGDLNLLLKRYSSDSSMAVRAMNLLRFANFHQKAPDLGWQFLGLMSQNASPSLLEFFERPLYYKYTSEFENVRQYLDQLLATNHEGCGRAWGRLATLSYLSDSLSEDELWRGVDDGCLGVQEGMAEVFLANIHTGKHGRTCTQGMVRLMVSSAPGAVFDRFTRMFNDDGDSNALSFELIQSFVNNCPISYGAQLCGVFTWCETNVLSKLNQILELVETLIDRLDDQTDVKLYYHSESILSTLKCLLQEADLTDDESLINRVLIIQDWFYFRGLSGIELLLEAQ